MKKIISFFLLFAFFGAPSFAQSNDERAAAAAQETKAELTTKMGLAAPATDSILVIENQFHSTLAGIAAQSGLKIKDREVKLNQAHVNRRARLMATPLSPRQMEDVIAIVEAIRRKHKL